MNADQFADPYRKPCTAWPVPVKFWRGGQYQHFRASANGIPAFENISTVANYADPSAMPTPPATIAPYPRPALPGSIPDCANMESDGTLGEQKVGAWPLEERTGGVSAQNVDNNFFQAVVDQVYDNAQCNQIGWKGAQAQLWNYGRLGFLNRDGCRVNSTPFGLGEGNCSYEPPNIFTNPLGPPAQTFLQMSFSVTDTTDGAGVGDHSGPYHSVRNWARTFTVGKQSGIITLTSFLQTGTTNEVIVEGDGFEPGDVGPTREMNFWEIGDPGGGMIGLDACGKNAFVEIAKLNNFVLGAIAHSEGGYLPWDIAETAGADDNYSVTLTHYLHDPDAPDGRAAADRTVVITFGLAQQYLATDFYNDLVALAALWPLNNPKDPWRKDGFTSVVPIVSRRQVPGLVSPDVFSQVAFLKDVSGRLPSETGYVATPVVIANPASQVLYDGSVIGAPNPDGYGPHFDWDHQTVRVCFDEDADHPLWYVSHYGAYSGVLNAGDITDLYVPRTATRWTTNFDAGQANPPWAFVRSQPSGPCQLQKYAWSKPLRPSLNFFGPCGAMRFAMDETMVRCVHETHPLGSDGSVMVLTVDIAENGSAADVVVGGTFIGRICGVSAQMDGIWTVTKTAADKYSIDTAARLYAAPADGPAGSCTGILGKLRWPDAWPICGRIAVAGASQEDGADVVIELETPADWLRTGDVVDLDGVAGLEAGNYAVTVESPTILTVPGTLGGYLAGGWVKSHGAPDYWWNDTGSKGDVLLFSAVHNLRDYQEVDRYNVDAANANCTGLIAPMDQLRKWQGGHGLARSVIGLNIIQSCQQFLPCCPAVVCISPNGETFDNGQTWPFFFGAPGDVDGGGLVTPVSFTPDRRYGSLWQGWVETEIPNPYWQVPHRPCADGAEVGPDFVWRMDDGSCKTGEYPHWPVIEARATVPDGAPALAGGLTLHYLSQVDIDQETITVAGKIVSVPVPPGNNMTDPTAPPLTPETPETLWLKQVGCVYGSPLGSALGLFAQDYKGNGI